MLFRSGNRHQVSLLPSQLEDYVPETDPVRAYDAFVEALELEALGLKLDRNKRGCCEYDPKSMVKLLVYGYSYGVTSSRKLERATHHNLSFIWLMGGLKPNFKTIARFRKQNLGLLKKVLGKSVKMCLKLGLIEGNTLFIDGSKIRGNAGRSKHITLKYAKEQLEGLEKRIEELLEQVEKQDKSEQGLASHQDLQEELKKRGDLFHDMKACIQEMEEEDREKMNRTDKEAVMFKSRQGSHVGYNVQNSVDEKHGLVVSSDVVNEATDRKQLGAQVMEAEQALEQEVKTVCADSGYDNLSEAAPLHERGIELIVPNQEVNESNKKENDFSWRAFKYDQQSDTYRCPTGELLRFNAVCKIGRAHV